MDIFMGKGATGIIKELGMMENGKTVLNMGKASINSLQVTKKNKPVLKTY